MSLEKGPSKGGDELSELSEDGIAQDCVVCLEALTLGVVLQTPCGHHFHQECLAEWCALPFECVISLRRSKSSPVPHLQEGSGLKAAPCGRFQPFSRAPFQVSKP